MLSFESVFVFSTNFDDSGRRLGNTAKAFAKWRHPVVASNEALDVLYQAMRPTSYCRIYMAIEITSNSPAFFVIINVFVDHNCS
jgi:hypothetical protein